MFSFNTIQNFDEHIDQSIPNYSLLFDAVISLSKFFAIPDTKVIDLGCSTGKLLKTIKHQGNKIGIDISDNLLPESNNDVTFLKQNIETFNAYQNSSLITSIFTLQFMPKESRQETLNKIYAGLNLGGAFIWAEKVYAPNAMHQDLMSFCYYDYKQTNFSAKQILDKEKDLRTLLHSNTAQQNLDLARNAGFNDAQMFWSFYNFQAWYFVK
jgi:tRNA (cmo5U34)-methyltransferase